MEGKASTLEPAPVSAITHGQAVLFHSFSVSYLEEMQATKTVLESRRSDDVNLNIN